MKRDYGTNRKFLNLPFCSVISVCSFISLHLSLRFNLKEKEAKMEQRKLGNQGLSVSAIGLGCMGMSYAYGSADENTAIETINEAIDLGVDFFDTAEIYGPFENEKLLGRALKGKRDQVIIATKFGFEISPDGKITGANSRPEHV